MTAAIALSLMVKLGMTYNMLHSEIVSVCALALSPFGFTELEVDQFSAPPNNMPYGQVRHCLWCVLPHDMSAKHTRTLSQRLPLCVLNSHANHKLRLSRYLATTAFPFRLMLSVQVGILVFYYHLCRWTQGRLAFSVQ